ISAAAQELAIELGAAIQPGPASFVWATSTGESDDGFKYCWLPDKECEVSAIPGRAAYAGREAEGRKSARPKADPVRFKELQREFDELHERIYAAREPVDGSNDLTAQLCKCIFLKMHFER